MGTTALPLRALQAAVWAIAGSAAVTQAMKQVARVVCRMRAWSRRRPLPYGAVTHSRHDE
jgi:hypothetical protein